MPQRSKWRTLRIMHEIAPVPVFRRPFARDYGRHARRTISKYGREPTPVWSTETGERLVPYYFPSQGVYKNEQRKDVLHKLTARTSARTNSPLHDLKDPVQARQFKHLL